MSGIFKLQPMGSGPLITLGLLTLLFGGIAVLIAFGPTPLLAKMALVLLFLAIAGLPWALFQAQRRATLRVDATAVRIDVPIYARSFKLSDIDAASLHLFSIRDYPDLKPLLRTNGIGMPGLAVGWYRLRNGSRAYIAATTSDVLGWRMKDGLTVMVGLDDGAGALALMRDHLKSASQAAAR
ncbi:MAG: hypothetical protein EKK41_06115 [Hyphomicrobiales bacterium]|nr:MAG: hypothetical protein EKK41_06115 [Hyphomicrobiales bacterium]